MVTFALIFGFFALLLGFLNAWRDSRNLGRVSFLCLVLAIGAVASPDFLSPLETTISDKVLSGLILVSKFVAHIKIKPVETAQQQKQTQPLPSAQKPTFTITPLVWRVPLAAAGPPRFTSVYPRHVLFPDYEKTVQRYPSLDKVFAGLEQGQWDDGAFASGVTITAMEHDSAIHSDVKKQQDVVLHLQAVALLESGRVHMARVYHDGALAKAMDDAVDPLEISRLKIDRAIALAYEAVDDGDLPADMVQHLLQDKDSHLQELALFYHARALEYMLEGSQAAGAQSQAEAARYVVALQATEPAAADRLAKILGIAIISASSDQKPPNMPVKKD
jgi:hypothetical protein